MFTLYKLTSIIGRKVSNYALEIDVDGIRIQFLCVCLFVTGNR